MKNCTATGVVFLLLTLAAGPVALAASTLDVTSPAPDASFVVPVDSENARIRLEAIADSDADVVYFGLDGEYTSTYWQGTEYAQADLYLSTCHSYRASYDLIDLMQGVPGEFAQHHVYALGGVTMPGFATPQRLNYTLRSDAGTFTLHEAPADSNNNGLCNHPLSEIGNDLTWLASYTLPIFNASGGQTGSGARTVTMASLDSPESITLHPAPWIDVTVPRLEVLQYEGAVTNTETAYVAVSVIPNIALAVDTVSGDSSSAAIGAWAADAQAKQPLDHVDGIGYINLSLIAVSAADGQYQRVINYLPKGVNVDVQLHDVELPEGSFSIWSYPSAMISSGGEMLFSDDSDKEQVWVVRDKVNPGGADCAAYSISLRRMSLLGVFRSPMALTSVSQSSHREGESFTATLKGDFWAGEAMSLDDTQNAYNVTLSYAGAKTTVPITITGGLTLSAGEEVLTVEIPAIPTPGPCDITVERLVAPLGQVVKTAAITITPVYSLTFSYGGSASGVVTLQEGAGLPVALPAGTSTFEYDAGTMITMVATPDDGMMLTGWTGSFEQRDSTLLFEMEADTTVTAVFDPLRYRLDATCYPGGSVTTDPEGPWFAPDSVISIEAVPRPGECFNAWSGDIAPGHEGDNPLTMRMDRDKTLQAHFIQACTIDPEEATAYVGSTKIFQAHFTACANPDPSNSIFWKFQAEGGDPVTVSTAQWLTVDNITMADAGNYWCDVISDGRKYSSNTATLEVFRHLSITTQPEGIVTKAGGCHTLTVEAEGGIPPLRYAWIKNGTTIGSAQTLTLEPVHAADIGTYQATIIDSNDEYRVSDPAVVAFSFASAPSGERRFYEGEPITLEVDTSAGCGSAEFTWWFQPEGAAPLSVGTGTEYSIPALTTADSGTYWCSMTGGGRTSSAAPFTAEVAENLRIKTQPVGGQRLINEPFAFTVEAEGGFPPLHYEWKFKGATVGNEGLLDFPRLAMSDTGTYHVEVTDDETAHAASEDATLTVVNNMTAAGIPALLVLAIALAGLALFAMNVRLVRARVSKQ